MKLVEIIRNQSDLHQKGANAAHGVEKCSGCPWVGWLHAEHHAEMIARAVDEWFGGPYPSESDRT